MGYLEVDMAAKREKRFKKLPDEWREEHAAADTTDLKEVIRQAAMNNAALAEAKKVDQALAEAAQAYSTAKAPYSEGKQTNEIKIEFCMMTLKERGEPIPGIDDFLKQDAE